MLINAPTDVVFEIHSVRSLRQSSTILIYSSEQVFKLQKRRKTQKGFICHGAKRVKEDNILRMSIHQEKEGSTEGLCPIRRRWVKAVIFLEGKVEMEIREKEKALEEKEILQLGLQRASKKREEDMRKKLQLGSLMRNTPNSKLDLKMALLNGNLKK